MGKLRSEIQYETSTSDLIERAEIESRWPKVPPLLTQTQIRARQEFLKIWLTELPSRYPAIEMFNHYSVAKLPIAMGSKTLEIGAGLGEHAKFEDLKCQDYYFQEIVPEFARKLAEKYGSAKVICSDIHERQVFENEFFDRVIAVHVLEHLNNLPLAVREICRILKPDGFFDVVLPCEGKFAYGLARKISAERVFVKTFKMDYTPIIRNEHCNEFDEIYELLMHYFEQVSITRFPLNFLPFNSINLVVALRLKKRGTVVPLRQPDFHQR